MKKILTSSFFAFSLIACDAYDGSVNRFKKADRLDEVRFLLDSFELDKENSKFREKVIPYLENPTKSNAFKKNLNNIIETNVETKSKVSLFTNKNVPLSPSLLLFHHYDFKECPSRLEKAKQLGSNSINLMITHYMTVDRPYGDISRIEPTEFKYRVATRNNNNYYNFDSEIIAAYKQMIKNCIKSAYNLGFHVKITPHLDVAPNWIWRNKIVFSPVKKFGAYSYEEIMVKPIFEIYEELSFSYPEKKFSFSFQGEMSATVFFYPDEYLNLYNKYKKKHKNVSIGIGLNREGFFGNGHTGLSEHREFLKKSKKYSNRISLFNALIKSVQKLILKVDFVAYSQYFSYDKPTFKENSIDKFIHELKKYGLDDYPKNIQFGEIGLGGSEGRNEHQIKTESWNGPTNDFYDAKNDPWIKVENKNYRKKWHNGLLSFLKEGHVKGAYLWSFASWDPQGLYRGQQLYQDNEIIQSICMYNINDSKYCKNYRYLKQRYFDFYRRKKMLKSRKSILDPLRLKRENTDEILVNYKNQVPTIDTDKEIYVKNVFNNIRDQKLHNVSVSAKNNKSSEVSASVLMFSHHDFQNCKIQLRKAATYNNSIVNFMVTHYMTLKQNEGEKITVDGFFYKIFINNSPVYLKFNQDIINGFKIMMRDCFYEALKLGINIKITPHLDSVPSWVWRNGVTFSPLVKYQNQTYFEVVLLPLLDAYIEAKKSVMTSSKLYFSMQGEMSASVFFFPEHYVKVMNEIKKRIPTSEVGIGLNWNKISGNENSLTSSHIETLSESEKKSALNLRKNIQKLFDSVDFLGFSAYFPMKKNDYDFYKYQVMGFKNEVESRGLSLDSVKKLFFSEVGLGGVNNSASLEDIVSKPWEGVNKKYSVESTPWKTQEKKMLRLNWHKALVLFLNKQNRNKLKISGTFLWNQSSYDALGIYSGHEGYRDQSIVNLIKKNNKSE